MHVLLDAKLGREMCASSSASIIASNNPRLQKPGVENVVLAKAVAKDNTVMSLLIMGASAGTIFALAAIFTTVIDWSVLGWRNLWLAVCVAGFIGLTTFISMACARF